MSDYYTKYFGSNTLHSRTSAGGSRARQPVKAATLLFGLACAAGQLAAQVNIGQLQLTAPNFGNQTIGLYNFTGTTNGCAQMEPAYNVCNAVNINTWQLTVYFTPNVSGLPSSPLTFTSNGSGDIIGPTNSDFDAYTGDPDNPWVLSFDQVNAGCSPSCDAQITRIVFSGTIDTSTLELYNGAVGGPYTADPLSSQNFSVTWNIPASDYTSNPDSLFDSINLAVAQQPVITFDPVSTKLFGASPFQLMAQSSTGAAVTYVSATTAVCTVASGLVTLLTPGTCSITASDATDGATPVTRTFAVNTAKPSGTLTAISGSPFPTGTNPVSVATGDFNGDGIPDLVTTNAADGNVTVLLGNSSGGGYTAATGSPFRVGTNPVAVVTGDFNGDGALDLAVADNGAGNITILLGNGMGGFTAGQGSSFAVGNSPAGLATGDFNGDGIEDIAVANSGDGTVTVLLGTGSGSFTRNESSVFGVGASPQGIVVGDFNGDRIQDLAIANGGSNSITVLIGNGSGGFSPVNEGGFGVGTDPTSLVAGDFNADGILDLAATDVDSGDVAVLLGTGHGLFNAAPGSPFLVRGTPVGLVAGDFNGDGLPDLAVVNANGVTVLLGTVPTSPGTPTFIAAGTIFQAGTSTTALAAADFNGDGILDLAATSNFNGGVAVLLGGIASTNSVLSTTSALTINVGQSVPLSLTVSDNAGAGFNAPTGAVTFLDGGTGIATATQTTSPYTFTVASPGAGTHTYTANYAGDLRSSASSSNAITIQVNGNPQTITFGPLSNQTIGIAATPLSATSTSGLTVTFASTTTAVCTVSGVTITLLTTGTCSITASQAGNATYAAAMPVVQAFTVAGATQTITFGPLSNQTIGAAPPALSATASSGLVVSFASTTPTVCTVSGTTITLLTAGSCSITASQSGNASYQAATPVVRAFTVLSRGSTLSILTPANLGEIGQGAGVSTTYMASGGTSPYVWSATGLPAGLFLNGQTGVLSGSPSAGNYTFAVTVTDSEAPPATAVVSATLQVLGITTSSLPGAAVGVAYSQTLAAAGGTGNYTFSSTNLPAGFSLSGATLTGTPATAGTFPFQVQVSDGSGATSISSFSLTVTATSITITGSGTLAEIAFGAAVSFTPAAAGGKSPYTWSAQGLPAGMTLNTATGALGGTPSLPGNYSFTLKVSDSQTPPATATLAITLQDLGITTSSLPGATLGSSYTQALAAAGGSGAYAFTSSNLPPGLSIAGSTLTGTPTSAGTFPFQVQVSDGSGTTSSASLSLTVTVATLTITGAGKLGEIALGTSVAATPGATGGKPPYTWSAQNLPAGVSLNATSGALGGSPSQPGNYSFTLQVSDSQTPAATANLPVSLQVLGFLTGGTLPAGSTTTAYSQTLIAAGGTGPYTFSSTNLPAGLSLTGATLSGTPSKVGSYSFTITVSDAASFSTSSAFSLEVTGPASTPLSVSGGALAGGASGVAYSQQVTAAGGTPPYTWIVEGGALPPGLSLDGPSGTISGTPSAAGLYTFTAEATDSAKTTASGVFTITIAPPPLNLSGLPFPNGIVGSSYPLQILTGSGGVGPYTFAVTSGTLPPGLSFSSGELSGIPTSNGAFGFTITMTDSETPALTVSSATQVTIASAASANLILSAGSLSFNLTTGAAGLPASDNVTVQSSIVQQLLTYSVVMTPQVSWLDVGAGGSTPGSFSVGLDPSATNLGASSTPLTTTIVVTCLAPSPCAGLSQNIGVSLSVTAPAPELTFLTNLVQFSSSTAATATTPQQVAIQNIGGGSATISSASAADPWLTVTGVPASVPSGPPVNLTFTANPVGLGVGFYRTVVTIESTGGTITVPVTLSIASAPSISLSTSGAQFQSILGTAPGNTAGSFQVGVTGASTLNWTASVLPGSPWLVLGSGSTSGSATTAAPSTVAYSIDPVAAAALTPAQAYYGTIQIAAAGAANSPQNFLVILNVAPAGALPVPDPEPAGLIFISAAGGSAPAPKTINVYSSSSSAANYSAAAKTSANGTWLAVSPVTGKSSVYSPGVATVTVTPGTLPAGIYFGTVSYQFSAAAVRTVNVTLLVLPASFSSVLSAPEPDLITTSQAPACTPTQLVPTQTGLVTNFAQPAAWPTPLSLTVLDNCGSAVGTGQVIATFSNGDPPLALKLANASTGLYSGTWTPRALSGQVSVTATVNAPGFSPSVSTITGQVVANAAPALAAGGVLHIYDPLVGAALGQGTILQIYGTNMGASPAVPTTLPLPTSLNGTSVIVGGIPAPLYYVSANQIDAQLPYELTAGNSYQVIVNANGALSTPQTIQIAAATPGMAAFASGQIVAQHPDYSLVSETSPARPGEYLVIYLSGLGQTNNVIPDGAATPASPYSIPLVAPVLTLNGVSIPIYFSGLTPGYVGLFQMNFQVPPGTPNGDMQLVVSQAGTAGNSTILPVHN